MKKCDTPDLPSWYISTIGQLKLVEKYNVTNVKNSEFSNFPSFMSVFVPSPGSHVFKTNFFFFQNELHRDFGSSHTHMLIWIRHASDGVFINCILNMIPIKAVTCFSVLVLVWFRGFGTINTWQFKFPVIDCILDYATSMWMSWKVLSSASLVVIMVYQTYRSINKIIALP